MNDNKPRVTMSYVSWVLLIFLGSTAVSGVLILMSLFNIEYRDIAFYSLVWFFVYTLFVMYVAVTERTDA